MTNGRVVSKWKISIFSSFLYFALFSVIPVPKPFKAAKATMALRARRGLTFEEESFSLFSFVVKQRDRKNFHCCLSQSFIPVPITVAESMQQIGGTKFQLTNFRMYNGVAKEVKGANNTVAGENLA